MKATLSHFQAQAMSIINLKPSSTVSISSKKNNPHVTIGAIFNQDLLAAAAAGNNFLVNKLLEQDAYINIVHTNGNTALHLATLNNHYSTVNLLLENGADLSAINQDSNTALHLASKKGFYEIVKLLILRGADGKAVNSNQETPLQLAESSLKELSSEFRTATKFQKILHLTPENLLQRETELKNISETIDILKVQQKVLTQISATPLKSQQTNIKTL